MRKRNREVLPQGEILCWLLRVDYVSGFVVSAVDMVGEYKLTLANTHVSLGPSLLFLHQPRIPPLLLSSSRILW